MKTANLTGALLDYHTARAEGVPADQLEIRPVQRPDPRTPDAICVRHLPGTPGRTVAVIVLDYSTNWALAGPLVETYGLTLEQYPPAWWANEPDSTAVMGDTPLIAICRAVVRAAFGDEVGDLPCA